MSMYMSTANKSSQTSHEEMEDKSTDSTENKITKTATPTSKCNQWSKNEVVLVTLPTSNSFSSLQDPPEYLQEKKHKTNQRALIPSTLLIPPLPTTALGLPIILMKWTFYVIVIENF